MAGNSIGQLFKISTFGESHGPALGCVIDGCPPGLEISLADLQGDLDRRKPGTSKYTTQRREADEVKILSGIFEGKTTGCSIGLVIENTDQRSQDYSNIKDTFRPGHADYTYHQKFGHRDYRGGGRSSARETAMRVAAGAIAKKYLQQQHGIIIRGYLSQLGPIKAEALQWDQVEQNPFFFPDPTKLEALDEYMRLVKPIQRSIDQARLWRMIMFPKATEGYFRKAFERGSSLQMKYLELLAGEAEYADLRGALLRRIPKLGWRLLKHRLGFKGPA